MHHSLIRHLESVIMYIHFCKGDMEVDLMSHVAAMEHKSSNKGKENQLKVNPTYKRKKSIKELNGKIFHFLIYIYSIIHYMMDQYNYYLHFHLHYGFVYVK